ncbi:MAG: esterase [Verrucomicrobia bacterium]|nr:esterase [Verrucomicrobiota bacterium]
MHRFLLLCLSLVCTVSLSAQAKSRDVLTAKAPEGLVEKSWTIDGVKRTALLRVPAGVAGQVAVVFGWHGHGGRATAAAGKWGYDSADTTSLLVFPQGLPTVSPLVDKEGRLPGWQTTVGSEGDRDIHLFDAILADLKKQYPVDERRIFSMGHSNGAAFSYLLWQARPEVLAAIGSVAGGLRGEVKGLPPMPVIHVAGEKDPIVKFSWQQATFAAVRRFNSCSEEGKPWAKEGVLDATIYTSTKGAPLVTAIHGGGHEYAKGSSELIVRFFKENPKPAK